LAISDINGAPVLDPDMRNFPSISELAGARDFP
jgi:hypothetical protein